MTIFSPLLPPGRRVASSLVVHHQLLAVSLSSAKSDLSLTSLFALLLLTMRHYFHGHIINQLLDARFK